VCPSKNWFASNQKVSGEHHLEWGCQLMADDNGKLTQHCQKDCRCYNAKPLHCCSTTPLVGSDRNS